MFYIIKTIHVDSETKQWNASSDGIFLSVSQAFGRIERNSCDLCDGGYNQYAVVLRFEEGMYPLGEEIQWFIWDKYAEEYVRTIQPEFMEGWVLSL